MNITTLWLDRSYTWILVFEVMLSAWTRVHVASLQLKTL